MIKIVIPANMPTVLSHLRLTGRDVEFTDGQDFGWIENGKAPDFVVRLRSLDIPIEVDDSCDVGLCGSDVYEERRFTFPLNLEVLGRFSYGRIFRSSPSLDLVGPKEESVKNPSEFKPGTIILTEHPNLTKNFLENFGWKGKVAILDENLIQPKLLPEDFKNWCAENDTVCVRVVEGKIPALVRLGSGYGVMVNETSNTLKANELRVISKIMNIETLLIADRQALADREKGAEIRRLAKDLEEAYLSISSEYESKILNHEREI